MGQGRDRVSELLRSDADLLSSITAEVRAKMFDSTAPLLNTLDDNDDSEGAVEEAPSSIKDVDIQVSDSSLLDR